MRSECGKEACSSPPASNYLPWLFLAIILHGLIFVSLTPAFFQQAEYSVRAGDSSLDVDLLAAPPRQLEPEQVPQPISETFSSPPEKQSVTTPDDITLPLPSAPPATLPLASSQTKPPATAKNSPPTESKVKQLKPAQVMVRSADRSLKQGEDSIRAQTSGGAAKNATPGYLDNPAPPYPEFARQEGEEGLVNLMVFVDEQGRVTSVRLIKSSGYHLLDHNAMETVRTRWLFKPARAKGVAIPSHLLIPIHFRLSE